MNVFVCFGESLSLSLSVYIYECVFQNQHPAVVALWYIALFSISFHTCLTPTPMLYCLCELVQISSDPEEDCAVTVRGCCCVSEIYFVCVCLSPGQTNCDGTTSLQNTLQEITQLLPASIGIYTSSLSGDVSQSKHNLHNVNQ